MPILKRKNSIPLSLESNLGFFKSRITLDASYFMTKTTDLITNTTPSITSGATAFLTNIGELQGKGFELTVGGALVQSKNIRWDLSLNYTTNETKVIEIKEGLEEILLSGTSSWGVYAIKGMAFPQIKANTYVRDPQGRIVIDPSTGYPEGKCSPFTPWKDNT